MAASVVRLRALSFSCCLYSSSLRHTLLPTGSCSRIARSKDLSGNLHLQVHQQQQRRHSLRYSTAPRSSSLPASAAGSYDEDDDENESGAARSSSSSSSSDSGPAARQQPEKPLRVERLLANLGYGKRQECAVMLKRRRVVYADSGKPAKVGEKALAAQLLLDGQPLDPPPPLAILLHKPTGYVVTSPGDENVSDPKIYDLLPLRFGRRRPFLSAIGRLDKETSGLLLLTDDGKLLHSIQSPARGIWKLYTAQLGSPLTGREAAAAARRFGSGGMQLVGDRSPLLPAGLRMLDDTTAEVAICEGRYHQIRRMFASIGREVVGLHRHAIGGLSLPQLGVPEGSWAFATAEQLAAVLSGPDLQANILQQQQQPLQQPLQQVEQQRQQEQQQVGQALEREGRQQAAAAASSSGRRQDRDAMLQDASGLGGARQQQRRRRRRRRLLAAFVPGEAAWAQDSVASTSSADRLAAEQTQGLDDSFESDDSDADQRDDDAEVRLEEEQTVRRYRSSRRWQQRRATVASSMPHRQTQLAD